MSSFHQSCIAVIPCFNEADHIRAVVEGARDYLSSVILVDDGSTDTTAQIAKDSGADVVRLPKNSGKGAALRAGWQRANEQGFSWVLMLDGDGQHSPRDIPNFFAAAEKTGARLIVGNRMENAEGMPWLRRTVNQWMSRRISEMAGVTLPDSQCGFRLAHVETLLRLQLTARRFEIESEMLLNFLIARERIEFVSIETIYNSDASKIRPIPDTWRWLRWRLNQRAGQQPVFAVKP